MALREQEPARPAGGSGHPLVSLFSASTMSILRARQFLEGNEMLAFRSAVMVCMFTCSTAIAHADEFPVAPPRLKDAEAQGLARMSAAELKESLPGTWVQKGTKGKRKKTFNPDGTAYRTGFIEMEGAGTWRIDEKNNAYCNTFRGKKLHDEDCFVVFRATDGTHYFDYELDTGFHHAVRRKAADE